MFLAMTEKKSLLKGAKVLVTAGPTREYIDPVRFLSNPSTGQMGYALAQAARLAGAKVTLISGPTDLTVPKGLTCIDVVSAAEMYRETTQAAKTADYIFMTAAVADYRPLRKLNQKMKKQADDLTLRLTRTRDILATLGKRKTAEQLLIGFAAETKAVLVNARSKLERKNLDMIVANHVRPGNAFGTSTNEVTVLYSDGTKKPLPRMTKERLAQKLMALAADYCSR